jgi:hypothetical protein
LHALPGRRESANTERMRRLSCGTSGACGRATLIDVSQYPGLTSSSSAKRLNIVHLGMLISLGYPSRESAILAAFDLCDNSMKTSPFMLKVQAAKELSNATH